MTCVGFSADGIANKERRTGHWSVRVEGTWADLQSRGFVVAREFLTPDDLAAASHDATAKLQRPSIMKKYFAQGANGKALAPLMKKALAAIEVIRGQTDLRVNTMLPQGTYVYSSKAFLPWHTDHLSYYLFQNHYHFVNFWIPIIKPDPTRSGLRVVPMDVLAARDRNLFEATHSRGGADYEGFQLDGFSCEIDGTREHFTPQVDLEEISEAPSLSAGDALIVRGDVLHRTQDQATNRIAISIRAVNPDQVIHKKTFLTMSEDKYKRLKSERKFTASLLAAFQSLKRDAITSGEYLDFMNRLKKGGLASLATYFRSYASTPGTLARHHAQPTQ